MTNKAKKLYLGCPVTFTSPALLAALDVAELCVEWVAKKGCIEFTDHFRVLPFLATIVPSGGKGEG